jgi:hypothetical protein
MAFEKVTMNWKGRVGGWESLCFELFFFDFFERWPFICRGNVFFRRFLKVFFYFYFKGFLIFFSISILFFSNLLFFF